MHCTLVLNRLGRNLHWMLSPPMVVQRPPCILHTRGRSHYELRMHNLESRIPILKTLLEKAGSDKPKRDAFQVDDWKGALGGAVRRRRISLGYTYNPAIHQSFWWFDDIHSTRFRYHFFCVLSSAQSQSLLTIFVLPFLWNSYPPSQPSPDSSSNLSTEEI